MGLFHERMIGDSISISLQCIKYPVQKTNACRLLSLLLPSFSFRPTDTERHEAWSTSATKELIIPFSPPSLRARPCLLPAPRSSLASATDVDTYTCQHASPSMTLDNLLGPTVSRHINENKLHVPATHATGRSTVPIITSRYYSHLSCIPYHLIRAWISGPANVCHTSPTRHHHPTTPRHNEE